MVLPVPCPLNEIERGGVTVAAAGAADCMAVGRDRIVPGVAIAAGFSAVVSDTDRDAVGADPGARCIQRHPKKAAMTTRIATTAMRLTVRVMMLDLPLCVTLAGPHRSSRRSPRALVG